MSWRSQATVTGTNDIPVANRRRFGPPVPEEAPPPPPPSFYDGRGREPPPPPPSQPPADPNAPRKRKSRWGDAKPGLPGLPTAVSSQGLSAQELDNYAVKIRLEEINHKLRTGDVVPPERERSPSPPPTYDAHGRRTNTREIRYRRRLEDERLKLVDRALKSDPTFQPPVEYHQQKRSHRPQEKVYIPVKEFPQINFFGLLVGPRGNSLKGMERESGAKISIRGKGSVKEGKGRPDAYADDAEEDLHCLVMAETQDKVDRCVNLINKVIETAASTPEGENDHKRSQLRELAALNGTLRDDENQICQNCGNRGHRKYDCPEQRNFSANIICHLCGSAGHMARDCTSRRDPNGFVPRGGSGGPSGVPGPNGAPGTPGGGFDAEYASLMAELGEGGASGVARGPGGGQLAIGGGGPAPGGKVPPWRLPEHWQSGPRPPQQGGPPGMGGGYTPGAGYGGYGGAPGGGYGGYGGQMPQQGEYGSPAAAAGYGGYQQPAAAAASYGQPGFDPQAAYAAYYQQQGGQ